MTGGEAPVQGRRPLQFCRDVEGCCAAESVCLGATKSAPPPPLRGASGCASSGP